MHMYINYTNELLYSLLACVCVCAYACERANIYFKLCSCIRIQMT